MKLRPPLAAISAACVAASLVQQATAAVITIEQPTPVSVAPGPAPDTRIGGEVPNTGGVVREPPAAANQAPSQVTSNALLATRTITTTNAELIAVAQIATETPVRVVLVGTADPALKALNEALAQNAQDRERLQAAINTNQKFRDELAAKGITVAKIVAMDVSSSGGVIIFYALV